jgi:hypothetical protein
VEDCVWALAPALCVKHKDKSREKRAIPERAEEDLLFIFIIEGP